MTAKVYKGNLKVETFEFGSLLPKTTVTEDGEFTLQSLKGAAPDKDAVPEEIIRLEREHESRSSFNIDDRVRQYRGLRAQEEADYEKRVSEEVERRVELMKQQSYDDGFKKGQEDGFKQAHEEAAKKYEEEVQFFHDQLEQAVGQLQEIYDENKVEAYTMVKNLTKWVVLKEIDQEGYLERLLEKLILEIKTKKDLVIRVNKSAFEAMPEIIEKVENKVGKLTNVRVEIELDLDNKGIILESENGIIDGSIDAQFASIDKLFESVGVDGSEVA
jgi:flagellar assembly protein FliH